MINLVLSFIVALIFVGIISFAARLWLLKESVNYINMSVQNVTKDMKNVAINTIKQFPNPLKYKSVPNGDHLHPTINPHEWNTISNKNQICWIHKKTTRKVCENRT